MPRRFVSTRLPPPVGVRMAAALSHEVDRPSEFDRWHLMINKELVDGSSQLWLCKQVTSCTHHTHTHTHTQR